MKRTSHEKRAEIPVTHTFLFGLVLFLAFSAIGAGSGPAQDVQGELSTTVVSDEFEDWDDRVGDVINQRGAQRERLAVPPGEIEIGEETEIIVDHNTGEEVITTAQFRFEQQRGGSDAKRTIYDAGLITEKQSRTATPIVLSEPRQAKFETADSEITTLNLIEFNEDATFSSSSQVGSSTQFDIEHDSDESITGVFEDVEIEVNGENAESWERLFERSPNYEVIDSSEDTVEVDVDVDELHLNSQSVQIQTTRD